MSRDTTLTDDEGNKYSLDSLSTQRWLEGHYAGLDACVNWLDTQASNLFSNRKTDEALAMQTLADRMKNELRPKMVERAAEHEKEFPYELPKESHE